MDEIKIGKGSHAFPIFIIDRMLPLFLALILGLCYSLSIAPGLTWVHFSADGGDLISAAATGGVPHPSGYPLYLVLAQGFQSIPVGNLAFRTNILSAVCTILTALLLYAYLLHQLRDLPLSHFVSFLAAMAYGLAPFVWGQALVTEVYAPHGLLMMLCLYVLSLEGSKISEWMRGLVFGLAATNHLTAIMMLPLLVLGSEEDLFVSTPTLLKRLGGAAGGLALYLSLPLRAYFHPPINWGDASTLDGFLWLIGGQIYRHYLFSLSPADMIQRLRTFGGLVLAQYTWLGALFGIYGLLTRPPRRVLIPTLWMGTVFLFFAITYGSYDSQVYLLPVWLALAIWIPYGLQDLLTWLHDHRRWQISCLGLLLVMMLIRIPYLFSSVDASKDAQAATFIHNSLQVIPRNSLVFVDGDEQLFSLWYAQFASGQRLDMAIIAEGLLPQKWYRENLEYTYPSLIVPHSDKLQPSDLAGANRNRPLCYISPAQPVFCLQDR